MKGAVLYLRVSTADQVQNLSLATQRDRCEEFCAREGYDVVEVFEERGESAKTADRTEFKRALDFCSKNRRTLDAFVVYSFDRFARDTTDHHVYKGRLASLGIALRSTTQPTDATPWGQFAETIAAAQAKLDNDLRAMRTRDGMRAALERGRWIHQAPIGYSTGPRGGPSLLVDPDRAPHVARAFDLLAHGRCSQADVLKNLELEGLRTRAGRPVSGQTFQAMLRNPVYSGRIVNASFGVEARGDWEALISQETFDRVQLVLGGRRPSAVKRPRLRIREEFPLKHFTKCGLCGTPLTAEVKEGRHRYYRCRRRGCATSTVAAHLVEDGFLAVLSAYRMRPEYFALFREILLREHENRHAHEIQERKRLERRRDELAEQRRNLGRELIRNTLGVVAFAELRDEVDRDLADIRIALKNASNREVDIESVLSFAERLLLDPAKMWRQLPDAKRRVFQSALFPEGVTWNEGGSREVRSPLTASFLADLRDLGAPESGVVSPTGFEPVLPP